MLDRFFTAEQVNGIWQLWSVHFAPEGAALIRSLWENQLLSDEVRDLLAEVGDYFFEDSLELQSVGHWTDRMLEEFEKRAGYSIRPYLPFILGINQDKGIGADKASFQVAEEDVDKVRAFRHDYYRVLNELYQDYHLEPLKEFAHSLGLKFCAQPYGWAIDSADAGARLDAVEGESLGFGEDGNDAFRMLAAGRDFGGVEILSDEAGAYLFQAYATTLPQLIGTLHKNYMAGVNQTYWHGMAYKYAPGAKWPTASAFSPMLGGRGFAEPWGPHQPVWEDLPHYTTYLARVQQVLRQGHNQVDVLVYTAGHNASENKQHPIGDELSKLGFTYQIATEGLLCHPQTVQNGQLVVKGATYSALYIEEGLDLPSDVAAVVAQFKAEGLPVLTSLVEVAGTLAAPTLTSSDASLLHYNRIIGEEIFTLVYNQGPSAHDLSDFLSKASYEEWDAWTGQVTAVVRVTLDAGELRIFKKVAEEGQVYSAVADGLSIANQAWTVTIDSWSMKNPENLTMQHQESVVELDCLQTWSTLAGYETKSGRATYRTTIPQARTLILPKVMDSQTVKVNGQEVPGNAITGRYDLSAVATQAENTLEITLGSTLSNYINGSPLAGYYSKLEPQTYGLSQAILIQ